MKEEAITETIFGDKEFRRRMAEQALGDPSAGGG